jgi:ribosome maturation factor RimP
MDVVAENSLKLYDMDYVAGSSTLRVFIMDPETKTAVIDDCVKIDRAMTPYFEEDWVPDDIVLEVSSPGVYRSLKTLDHFNMSKGELVLLNLEKSLDEYGQKQLPKSLMKAKKVRGKLIEVTETNIKLNIEGIEFAFNYSDVKKATLDPDL